MGDERLLETDYDRAVYDVTSPYQRVCIMQSRQFGHVLTLDDNVSKSPVPVFCGRFLWRVSVSSVCVCVCVCARACVSFLDRYTCLNVSQLMQVVLQPLSIRQTAVHHCLC